MALNSTILTRLEPTIELDKLRFKSYGEQAGDNPGNNHGSRALGVEFPLIMINNYRFEQEDISSFEISLEGIVPTISLTLIDSKSFYS